MASAARAAGFLLHLLAAGRALAFFGAGPGAPGAAHAARPGLHTAATARRPHLDVAHRAGAAAAARAVVAPRPAFTHLPLHPAVHARDHARRGAVGAVAVGRRGAGIPATVDAALDARAACGAARTLRHATHARARVVAVHVGRDSVAVDVARGDALAVAAGVVLGALGIARRARRDVEQLAAAIDALGVALTSDVAAFGAAPREQPGGAEEQERRDSPHERQLNTIEAPSRKPATVTDSPRPVEASERRGSCPRIRRRLALIGASEKTRNLSVRALS